MAKWNKGYQPKEIFRRLEETKIRDAEGGNSFNGLVHMKSVVVLNSMLSTNKLVPELEKKGMISAALSSRGKSELIKPDSYLREVTKLEEEYLKTPLTRHCIVTDLSIHWRYSLRGINFNGSRLRFSSGLNRGFLSARKEIVGRAARSITGNIPKDYSTVRAYVNARSAVGAAELALNSIDLIRGIWNLYLNRTQTFRRSSAPRIPVNRIILGPIHSIHDPSGSLSSEEWWYEPQYQGAIAPFNDKMKIIQMNEYLVRFRKCLRTHCYAELLKSSILRYTRALDSRDWEDSFLKLWGVLESLTGTQNDSYKVRIKRTSFLFKEREYEEQVLSHLKEYRNRSVHAGGESHDIESLMYQLKNYIETLFKFHIAHGNKFGSFAEATSVMDLPSDREFLDKKRKKTVFARKFLFPHE